MSARIDAIARRAMAPALSGCVTLALACGAVAGCAAPPTSAGSSGIAASQGSASAGTPALEEVDPGDTASAPAPGSSVAAPGAYARALPTGVLAGAWDDEDPADGSIACDGGFVDALDEGGIAVGDVIAACGAATLADAIAQDRTQASDAVRRALEDAGYAGEVSTDAASGDARTLGFKVGFPGGGARIAVCGDPERFGYAFKIAVGVDAYRGVYEYTTDVLPRAATLQEVAPSIFECYGADRL